MSQNGAADLIPTLRREVEQKQERVTKLEAELGAERAEYHQWRKVLAKLDPEALPPEIEKRPQQRKRTSSRTEPRMSEQRYAVCRGLLPTMATKVRPRYVMPCAVSGHDH